MKFPLEILNIRGLNVRKRYFKEVEFMSQFLRIIYKSGDLNLFLVQKYIKMWNYPSPKMLFFQPCSKTGHACVFKDTFLFTAILINVIFLSTWASLSLLYVATSAMCLFFCSLPQESLLSGSCNNDKFDENPFNRQFKKLKIKMVTKLLKVYLLKIYCPHANLQGY